MSDGWMGKVRGLVLRVRAFCPSHTHAVCELWRLSGGGEMCERGGRV